MKITVPQISKKIYSEDILDVLINRYSEVGSQWVLHQLDWTCTIYKSFNDFEKYLIVIYLTKKTLDFYSSNFIKVPYEQFYSEDTIDIEKFNIKDLAKNINIPKESVRRKVIELGNEGVIKKFKKKIIIDRSAYKFIKPIKSIERMSRFLFLVSKLLADNKILEKNISSSEVESVIKDNFSYVWKLYYELQIPMLLNYKKIFGDLETFAIHGACVVTAHLDEKKEISKAGRDKFIESLLDKKEGGLNAMSISEITGIPRATAVRKLKRLIKLKMLVINDKKHYKLSNTFIKKILPMQENVLKDLSVFSAAIFNLILLKS